MARHSQESPEEALKRPRAVENSRARQSSTGRPATDDRSHSASSLRPRTASPSPTLLGRIVYWWSLFVAGLMLLILGPPVISFAWLVGRREWVYPVGLFGARYWLRLSGVKVRVRGLEHLDPRQTYVFISNHRSYLDTAAIFYYTGRRIGIIAKKELLKVPILGYGMGYVNIMAIDRASRQSALETMRAATERLRSGISFGVFAEGTRAQPGEFLPFKKGAFYMAVEAGVPIVPVAIKNSDVLMGKGTGEAKTGTMEMILMPPVSTLGLSTDEDVRQLNEKVHAQISRELGIVS